MRSLQELRELASVGATSIDAPAVLLGELRVTGASAREFRTATMGDDASQIPSLEAATNDVATRVFSLEKSGRNPYDGFLFLGRASTCDVIIRDAGISKTHAVIEPAGGSGQWYLRDNRSRNGTFKNGTRLKESERTPLASGDLIQLGSYPLYFLDSSELLRLLRAGARPSSA